MIAHGLFHNLPKLKLVVWEEWRKLYGSQGAEMRIGYRR